MALIFFFEWRSNKDTKFVKLTSLLQSLISVHLLNSLFIFSDNVVNNFHIFFRKLIILLMLFCSWDILLYPFSLLMDCETWLLPHHINFKNGNSPLHLPTKWEYLNLSLPFSFFKFLTRLIVHFHSLAFSFVGISWNVPQIFSFSVAIILSQ
jgi:hypothetical protein